jgi:hypothetical protein
VQINNLFYSGAVPKKESEAAKTATQDQNRGEKLPSSTSTNKGQAPEVQAAQMGRSRPKRDAELLKGYKGGSDQKSVEQNVAETFQQKFISGNSADLVTIDLEILGDPYWLVDSGMANHFSSSVAPTDQITEDGTMNYESGNVYIYLTFRTPIDVNTTTGLYDFSQIAEDSPFGGIYRIVQCENTFSDGNWKQKLKCIRMPGPQGPETVKVESDNKSPVAAKADTPATKIGPKEPPKTSPIDNSSGNSSVTGSGQRASADPRRLDAPRSGGGSGQRASADPRRLDNKATTTTTSDQAPRVVGFRYYRDLGQK